MLTIDEDTAVFIMQYVLATHPCSQILHSYLSLSLEWEYLELVFLYTAVEISTHRIEKGYNSTVTNELG
jgi:hypothetical protein